MTPSHHPDYDRETDSIRLADLLDGIQGRRVLVAELQDGHRLYARAADRGDRVEAMRVNRSGGLCWRRQIDRYRLRALVERGVDAEGTVELRRYGVGWPSRFQEGAP